MKAPAEVRQMCRSLYRATGVPVDVERLEDGRWFLALNVGRVRMIGYFRRTAGRELRFGDSTLEIDGQLVKNCDGADHLAQIVRDPDSHVRASLLEQALKHEPITPAHPDDAPAAVRHTWGTLASRPPEGATVAVGTQDDGKQWVIEATTEQGILQMGWVNQGGVWMRSSLRITDADGKIHIVPDDQVDTVIRLLFGDGDSTVAAPASMGRSASGARQNSVEVRKSTVIRT